MLSIDQRLREAVARDPDRYTGVRNEEGELVQVLDADTGRVWVRERDSREWLWTV
jgi:hypothetical protein